MKLVKIDYQYPLGFYFLGRTYEQLKMPGNMIWAFERAIKNLSHLAESNPRFAKYYQEVHKKLLMASKSQKKPIKTPEN